MTGGLSDTEYLVSNGWYRFNWRRIESQRSEALMRRAQVFYHQVKRGIFRDYFALRDQDHMRSSAQFKDSHLRPIVDGPHPHRVHEPRGFFQSVCFKNDVADPEWGSKVFVAHLRLPINLSWFSVHRIIFQDIPVA